MNNHYKPGSWNAICSVCGFKFKADNLKQRWDGIYVCERDFEVRHPADLIKIPEDNPSVPWTQSEPPDTFV